MKTLELIPYLFVIAASVFALASALKLARWVLAKDLGTDNMQRISNAIKSGAEAFMKRMNMTIAALSVVVAILIFLGYAVLEGNMHKAMAMTVSFVVGALCSGFAGYFGMFTSIRTNIRVASAARRSLNEALQVALRGGAVSGLLVVALSLLGVSLMFAMFGGLSESKAAITPLEIVGFGFGASFVALFAQLGGGIYTKAADVGADLVGKVEAGIPEDDPRNPAVIADLVGDNVGDCAGRGADLFESISAENIGAMILGVALIPVFGLKVILLPLVASALGLLSSILGTWSVRLKGEEDPMKALNRGYNFTTALAIIGFFFACFFLLRPVADVSVPYSWLWFFGCGLVGIGASFLFVWITEYYTETRYRPVQQIAESCQTGPATTIISGLAVGLECTFYPILVISAAILSSFWMGTKALEMVTGEGGLLSPHSAGLYGTAVATMGMLSTAGYILAMDTFGPITDNAGGIVEMGMKEEAHGEIRNRTDRLDAVGNTTKALTKGYAVGSAALAAFLLFSAYLDQVWHYVQARGLNLKFEDVMRVDIGKPAVFVGGLVGAMLVFVFSALAMKAVSKAAQTVIEEVRRQFASDPGIMAGTSQPDYGRCVDIVTKGALKAMVTPGILPVVFPLVLGLVIRAISNEYEQTLAAESVAAMLMIATVAGILMALFMNNGGGAWDNAKKYIEEGNYGGKGSDAHKAAVVGDTVGDPFKDTAGPSLHVLIKLLSTLTLVMAPLFIG